MKGKVKSGKEIVEDFFKNIENIEGVDKEIAKMLISLNKNDKLTENNVRNELSNLRIKDDSKN